MAETIVDEAVEVVVAERGNELDSPIGDDEWRRRLMDVEHDALAS